MEEVNSNLTDQLQTCKVVGTRQGDILRQRDLGLSEEHVYLALQQQSRQKTQSHERNCRGAYSYGR